MQKFEERKQEWERAKIAFIAITGMKTSSFACSLPLLLLFLSGNLEQLFTFDEWSKVPLSFIVISTFSSSRHPAFPRIQVEIDGWLWIGHKLNTSVINIAFAKNCLSFSISPAAGIFTIQNFFFLVEFRKGYERVKALWVGREWKTSSWWTLVENLMYSEHNKPIYWEREWVVIEGIIRAHLIKRIRIWNSTYFRFFMVRSQ